MLNKEMSDMREFYSAACIKSKDQLVVTSLV
jgi:hypothetical protein